MLPGSRVPIPPVALPSHARDRPGKATAARLRQQACVYAGISMATRPTDRRSRASSMVATRQAAQPGHTTAAARAVSVEPPRREVTAVTVVSPRDLFRRLAPAAASRRLRLGACARLLPLHGGGVRCAAVALCLRPCAPCRRCHAPNVHHGQAVPRSSRRRAMGLAVTDQMTPIIASAPPGFDLAISRLPEQTPAPSLRRFS